MWALVAHLGGNMATTWLKQRPWGVDLEACQTQISVALQGKHRVDLRSFLESAPAKALHDLVIPNFHE